jgi:tetratricopeptide (TPR) repeat protein
MTLTQSAFWCRVWLIALALITPAAGSAQEVAPHVEARARVEHAKQLFDVRNYEAAFLDFSRAYALLDGHERRYVVLYNLAVCAERLFRYDEAVSFYERYLAEGGPDAENTEEIRKVVESLRALLAVVQVDSAVRGELWVDNRRLHEVPGTVRLPAGRHVIEVRARNHESVRRELELEAGSQTRLQIELQPISNYRGLSRSYFYTGTGLTAVALLTAASFSAVTLSERSYAQDLARDSMSLRTSELNQALDQVDGWARATDLTFAGTAVIAAGTLLLFALTDWSAAPPPITEDKAQAQSRSYW